MNKVNKRDNSRKIEHKKLNKSKIIKINLGLIIVIIFVILFAVSLQISKTTKTGIEVSDNLAESATETLEYSDEGTVDGDSEIFAISELTDGENTDYGISTIADSSDYTITVTEYTGDTLEAECDYEDGTCILYVVNEDTGDLLYVSTGTSFALSEILASLCETGYKCSDNTLFLSGYRGICMDYIYSWEYDNYEEVTGAALSVGWNTMDWTLLDSFEENTPEELDVCLYGLWEESVSASEVLADGESIWYGDNTFSADRFKYAALALMTDITPISYSITFDSNGADDGEMEAISATYDEEYTLTANTFTRDGYTFAGWNTEADGSGTDYEDGATVSNLTTEDGATVTLYAQWETASTDDSSGYTITVTEYTGDTLEAECDYEDGTCILYVVNEDTGELLYVSTGTSFALSEILASLCETGYKCSDNTLFLSGYRRCGTEPTAKITAERRSKYGRIRYLFRVLRLDDAYYFWRVFSYFIGGMSIRTSK